MRKGLHGIYAFWYKGRADHCYGRFPDHHPAYLCFLDCGHKPKYVKQFLRKLLKDSKTALQKEAASIITQQIGYELDNFDNRQYEPGSYTRLKEIWDEILNTDVEVRKRARLKVPTMVE